MNLKVLFNSECRCDDLSTGWGISFLINNTILFDTGEKTDSLLNNINKLNIDLSLIESVVISHDHFDHTGGLAAILQKTQDINVYTCSGFSAGFKDKLSEFPVKVIVADNFTVVSSGVYSTGERIAQYKGQNLSEQSLIIKTEKGFSLVTGCAHPGIVEIIESVKVQLDIKEFYSVLGGFHLKDHSAKEIKKIANKFLDFNVAWVGATHCSGKEAEKIFHDVYKDNCLSMKVGDTITI